MDTYLVIENGVVVNAVIWDGNEESWAPLTGQAAIRYIPGSEAWIGWLHVDGELSPPIIADQA